MNRILPEDKLEAVEDKYEGSHLYEISQEFLEKLKVRGQHVLSMDSEEWGELIRRYSFKVSDFLFQALKERNTKKELLRTGEEKRQKEKTKKRKLIHGRINPKDAFDPQKANDTEWKIFEKNVRHLAGEPDLDVGKLYKISHRMRPLGASDSMNAATEATHELITMRIQEIKNWFKKQEIWKSMMEGI